MAFAKPLWLLLSAVLLAVVADPCKDLAAKPSYDLAKNCMESFPFKKETFAATIDSVVKAAPMHVFIDVTKHSPDKNFQPDYDLMAELEAIKAKTTWDNEMQWNEAIATAFRKMNDAHSTFNPMCFRKFVFSQAFYPLAVVMPQGKTKIFVGGFPEGHAKTDRPYAGREIVKVDGVDALEYFWTYAQTKVGKYKDAGARFGDAMANMAWDAENQWQLWPGSWASNSIMPAAKTVTYTIATADGKGVETITRDWTVSLPDNEKFKDAADFYAKFCKAAAPAASGSNTGAAKKAEGGKGGVSTTPVQTKGNAAVPATNGASMTRPEDNEDLLHNYKTNPGRKPTGHAKYLISPKLLPAALIKSEGLAFFQVPQTKTGVLALTTFSLDKKENKKKWRETLAKIVAKFKECCKKLIVDVTGNGGGYLDLAWETIALLTPNPAAEFPMINARYKRDFRECPLHMTLVETTIKKAAKKNAFYPGWFGVPDTKNAFQGEDLIKPPRDRALDGTKSDPFKYSKIFQELPIRVADNPLAKLAFGLKHEDIIVHSSGDCGSACGLLSLHLREVDGVRTSGLGYFAQRPRTFATFPITEVFTIEQLVTEAKDLGLANHALVPKALPVNAVMRFPLREGFSRMKGKDTTPAELHWVQTDLMIDNTQNLIFRPDKVWRRIMDKAGWTAAGTQEGKPNVDPSRPDGTCPADNSEVDAKKVAWLQPEAEKLDADAVQLVVAAA